MLLPGEMPVAQKTDSKPAIHDDMKICLSGLHHSRPLRAKTGIAAHISMLRRLHLKKRGQIQAFLELEVIFTPGGAVGR
jgi:hypothetical protein